MIRKKVLACTAAATFFIYGSLAVPVSVLPFGFTEAEAADVSGIDVEYHSQEDISVYFDKHKSAFDFKVEYSSAPNTSAPYSAGALSLKTQENAIAQLNAIRYVAGIPYDVTLDADYAVYAQTGSLVNAANGLLSHFPAKPAGMSDEMYQIGSTGAGSSNIAQGYDLCSAIYSGWMSDEDSSNIDRVGHRRWCLDPRMKKTAFGAVKTKVLYGQSYYYDTWFTSMYAFDASDHESRYNCVSWPAQNTPTSIFFENMPWSVSLGSALDTDSINVHLTYLNTGKTYTFNSRQADGYFNVNNDYYATPGCIIFRPNDNTHCANGNSYKIRITGKYQNGKTIDISYNVNFFDLIPASKLYNKWSYSDGHWMYRKADGSYATSWAHINSKWYYFDRNGIMLTGWQRISGKWYFFNANGDMATGWKYTGNKWYYLNPNGDMATGWKHINSKWYYLNPSGDMATGWKYINSKWYYLDSNGAMVTGKRVINGVSYYFNSNGEMQ